MIYAKILGNDIIQAYIHMHAIRPKLNYIDMNDSKLREKCHACILKLVKNKVKSKYN